MRRPDISLPYLVRFYFRTFASIKMPCRTWRKSGRATIYERNVGGYFSERVTILLAGRVTVRRSPLTFHDLEEKGFRVTFSGWPKSL